MNNRLPHRAVLAVLLALSLSLCARYARAQQVTVLDNLANTPFKTTGLSSSSLFGQAFRTGSTGGRLASVTLPLEVETGSPNVTLTLHSYSATGFPTAMAVIGTQSVFSFGSYMFAPSTTIVLNPNTSYWIVARTNTGTTALWDYTLDNLFVGNGSFPAGVVAAKSNDGGASFVETYGLTDGPQQLAVVIAVPEADTGLLLLAGASLISLVGCLRRRPVYKNNATK